jgi:[acyl-carrier-protein] S-malonyltransferase/trans-AT polyketide synthase/acyltransferase/oxidoreductase domain-containing protein
LILIVNDYEHEIQEKLSIMVKNTIAVVFPGQGAQRPGMGKDFYDNVPASREVYEEASQAAGWDIASMCFGEDERLNLTEFTQPCILTTEIAMLRGMQTLFGFSPVFFGGHSLGEFTALVAAGALSLSEAVKIVQIRGRLMQEAVPVGVGAMAAVISDNIDSGIVRQALKDLPIDIANINSANQLVISGKAEAIPEAEVRLQEKLAKDKPLRFILLNVSAPFHSRFMSTIVEPFGDTLRAIGKRMHPEKSATVTSNYRGGFHSGLHEDLIYNLVSQLNNSVLWVDNMKTLAAQADTIYEIGPGRPLRDFFKTININCTSITTFSTAERSFAHNS